MLQNARVTAVTVSELLRDNQKGRVGKITPFHPYYNSYRPLTTLHKSCIIDLRALNTSMVFFFFRERLLHEQLAEVC